MNLKIKILPKTEECQIQLNTTDKDLLGINFNEDPEIRMLITPNIENQCIQSLESIPTAQLISNASSQQPVNSFLTATNILSSQLPSARIMTSEEIFRSIGLDEQNLAILVDSQTTAQMKKSCQNPFLSEMSVSLKLKNNVAKERINNLTLDHVYSSLQKRKTTADENSQDSIVSSSFTGGTESDANGPCTKKKRVRGIYRADDITNEEELDNYLERRKKNNISSKISRANKKNLYKHMDANADRLEIRNEELKDMSVKLANINEIIKKELIQMYNGKRNMN